VKVGDLVKRKTPPPPMGSIWKGIIIGMGEESNFEWMVYDFYESFIWYADSDELEVISECR
jgi:hypothetical protein